MVLDLVLAAFDDDRDVPCAAGKKNGQRRLLVTAADQIIEEEAMS
jgi:hypothetical protein